MLREFRIPQHRRCRLCEYLPRLQFINVLTGKTSVTIGDSLESETADVEVIRFIDDNTGRKVTIVDTPGFDDSRQGVTDTDILKKIADFLLAE